jgi:hypothetical protein
VAAARFQRQAPSCTQHTVQTVEIRHPSCPVYLMRIPRRYGKAVTLTPSVVTTVTVNWTIYGCIRYPWLSYTRNYMAGGPLMTPSHQNSPCEAFSPRLCVLSLSVVTIRPPLLCFCSIFWFYKLQGSSTPKQYSGTLSAQSLPTTVRSLLLANNQTTCNSLK